MKITQQTRNKTPNRHRICQLVLHYILHITLYTYLSASQLKDITVKSETDKDTISVVVSSKTKYNIFRVDEPSRIVIDLIDCEYATSEKIILENTQFIKDIRCAQYKKAPVKKSRVVIDLQKPARYSAKSTNDQITVLLTAKLESESKKQKAKISTTTATTETRLPDVHVKKSIETATVTQAKVVQVKPKTVTGEKPRTNVSIVKSTSAAEVQSISDAQSPEKISEVKPEVATSPVTSSSTVLTTIHVKPPKVTKPVETVIQEVVNRKTEAKPNVPDREHQELVKKIKEKTGEQEVKKPPHQTAQQIQKQKTPTKTGTLPKDPVTLDFTEADIKDVLQILAVKTGMNIIFSDDVSGTLSLHLENVPFDEAVNLILQMKGLVLQQVASNVLRVMTPTTLTKEREDAVQVTQIFCLSYSKASDMASKLTSIMLAESQKITVQTDERTNSVIVTSTPEGLLATASLIGKLDVKPEQVLIEARIVEITVGDTKDLGIDWTLSMTKTQGDATITENAESLTPSQSTIGSFTYGYLKSDIQLTARLAAAQSKGNAKILSQPRIATLNNMEAKIVVGDQIPYAQTTVTTAGSTQSTSFMTVGIQLTVTPTINADGRITMKVKPVVSYATRITSIGPQVSTREAETTVLVKNGETIVIGGMITDQERKDVSQIPLLGDLPVLGHFFRSQHHDKTKTELLVFVTPYIMKE